MITEKQKIERAREIINMIIQGKNPFTGEIIDSESFLNDSKMIRCLCFVNEILLRELTERKTAQTKEGFKITQEQLINMKLPDQDMGVSDFVNCVNELIDTEKMRRLSTARVNRALKERKILGETTMPDGSHPTTCNEISKEYGFYCVKARYNDHEYEKIMINEIGKKYLLDNLCDLLGVTTS